MSNNDTVQDKAVSARKNKRKKGSIKKTVFNAVFYILIIAMLLGAFVFCDQQRRKKVGFRVALILN